MDELMSISFIITLKCRYNINRNNDIELFFIIYVYILKP